MALSNDITEEFLKKFLTELRNLVKALSINSNRLPSWLRYSSVRYGWINNSLVAVCEDSPTNSDAFKSLGLVDADTVLLLDIENFVPTAATLPAGHSPAVILMVGEYGERGGVIFNLTGEYPAYFDCGHAGYHGPHMLWNFFFNHVPPSSWDSTPTATRFIPFALYIHKTDIEDMEIFLNRARPHIVMLLKQMTRSTLGDFYESLNKRFSTFKMTKESGVVVLGKDSSEAELTRLRQLRDHLKSKRYNAELIKELPEIPSMSNEEKVRLWSAASRFSIMIDERPSGSIAEYVMLREQRTILAFLRPRRGGSTFMIGDDDIDSKLIKTFHYDKSPLEIIDSVIEWCEQRVKERTAFFNANYPQR